MKKQPVPFSVSWEEVFLFQTLLEGEIKNLRKLYVDCKVWDDNLAESFAKRQRELWEKWKDLNKRLRESGESYYGTRTEFDLKSEVILR